MIPDPNPIPDPTQMIPDPTPMILDPAPSIPDPAPSIPDPAPSIPDPTLLIPDPTYLVTTLTYQPFEYAKRDSRVAAYMYGGVVLQQFEFICCNTTSPYAASW